MTEPRPLRAYLHRVVSAAAARAPADVVRQVARAIVDVRGWAVDPDAMALSDAPTAASDGTHPSVPLPPGDLATPDLLGQVYESLLDAGHRRARGAFYTPVEIADAIVREALREVDLSVRVTVCDPAMGGGAFLLAAARELEVAGHRRAEIVDHLLWGVDIDPVAVDVARTALQLWVAEGGDDAGTRASAPHLVVGDTLRDGMASWSDAPAGFGAVVGNPPFQTQRETATARDPERAAHLRARFGAAAYRYVDDAALFLVEACRMARPGGRVSLIVPQSVMVAEDAAAARADVLDLGVLLSCWVAAEPVFAASVRVCAPVIEVAGSDRGSVRRHRGAAFSPCEPLPISARELRELPTWAALGRDLLGVPAVHLAPAGTLADFCTATAGFRDQFYGIRPFVFEHEASASSAGHRGARLVTSGLIDPGRCLWGNRTTRFGGRAWKAPEVDLARLAEGDPALASWVEARLVPKIVVATQTRVIEAAVDEEGTWFPSVPTIALETDASRLWSAAAVVLSPVASAVAMGEYGGAALSVDAIKLSARQVLALPLPSDGRAWDEGADALRAVAATVDEEAWRAAMHDFGVAMGRAFAADDEVLGWWFGRLPPFR